MGIFSSKRQTHVSVTNTIAIPLKDRPRAITEATAQYIWDSPRIQDTFRDNLINYQLNAIEGSIVMKMKKAERWIKKYYKDFRIHSKIENTNSNQTEQLIQQYLQDKVNSTVTINYIIEGFEFRHLSKQILQEDHNWDAVKNTFTYQGETTYIEDVNIYAKYDTEIPPIGISYKSGYTPFREIDRTRLHTPITIDPSITGDHFIVTGVFKSEQVFERTKTTEFDAQNNIVSEEETTPVLVSSENMDRSFKTKEEYSNTEDTVVDSDTTNPDGTRTLVEITTQTIIYKNYIEFKEVFNKYANVDYGNEWLNGVKADDAGASIILNLLDVPKNKFEGYQYTVEYSYSKNGIDYIKNVLLNKDTAPTLNNYVTAKESYKEFIPRIYYRYGTNWITKRNAPTFYNQSKNYSKKIGYDYEDMKKQLRKQIKNNEDKIASIYMTFGIDVMAETKVERDYLRSFFTDYLNECLEVAGKSKITSETTYAFAQGIKLVTSNRKDGSFFRIGNIAFKRQRISLLKRHEYQVTKTNNVLTFKYQEKTNSLITFTIVNPHTETHVWEGHYAGINLGTSGSKVLVPISFDYIKNDAKAFKYKEALLYAAINIEVTTYVVTKKKWYQRGIFKVIVFVVGVVLSIYTGGASLSLAALATAVATNVAIGIAISLAINVLAKVLPLEALKVIGIVLAVVGAAYGVAQGFGQLSKAFAILNMNANTLIQIGQSFIGAYVKGIQKNLQTETAEWKKRFEDFEKIKEQTAVQRINVDTSNNVLQNNFIFLGESVDDMIRRTITTNIGQVAIDFIHQSVNYSLTLPTIKETLNYRKKI